MRPALLTLAPDPLAELLGGPGRSQAVFRALRAGRDPLAPGVLADGARARLAERTSLERLARRADSRAQDGTHKLLLGLGDGRAVEMVLIPEPRRTTVCVSTQVGCARGCTFCLTATMGLVRSLKVEEIVAQVFEALGVAAASDLAPVRNLVFMGMGEPLDNLEAVRGALAVLCDNRGFGFGPRHVTVSTVGPSPQAVRSAAGLPAQLAWSLHAADDQLRRRLVPTQRHPVAALRDAFAEVVFGRALFVEITLIDGENDGPEHAEAAARLFEGFPAEVRFNLLPMNSRDPSGAGSRTTAGPRPAERDDTPDRAPSPPLRVSTFREVLAAAGYFASVRAARGEDQHSACGQLATLPARRAAAGATC